jgi:hypothetical protein
MKQYLYPVVMLLLWWTFSLSADEQTKTEELQLILTGVAKKIAFEPYVGNLRSTSFVEQTKKANAFDRTLLLLDRLKKAGFRAHVARGELLDKSKQKLVESLAKEPGGYLYSLEPDKIEQALKTHYWVEVLLDKQLVAMDASFPDSTLGQSYGVKKGVVTALDPYQYKFKIVHKIKNSSGRVIVLGRYSSTTSLQSLDPISLVTTAEPILDDPGSKSHFLGGGLSGIAGGVAGKRAESTSKDAKIVGKRYWTNLVLNSGTKRFGQYQATFNIKGAAIEKEWLDITLTYPGKAPVTIERPLYSAKSGSEPADFRQLTINFIPGEIPTGFMQASVRSIADRQAPDKNQDPPSTVKEATPISNKLGLAAGSMLNLYIAAVSDSETGRMAERNRVIAVYDQPRIYITTLEGNYSDAAKKINYQLSFDYRLDDISAYYLQKDEEALSYYFSIARGLQQATIEGLLLDKLKIGGGYSATEIMLVTAQQGIEKYVITPSRTVDLSLMIDLPPAVQQHLENIVQAGYHAIVPEKAAQIEGKPYWAWWEFDPVTGKTRGVLEAGLHGATTEYITIERKLVINDQRAFVLGMLVGADSTHLLIISHILEGDKLDQSTADDIAQKLQQLACLSCTKKQPGIIDSATVSAKVGCFTLFKTTVSVNRSDIKKPKNPVPFCAAYADGFVCAAKMVFDRLSKNSDLNPQDPDSVKLNLSCPPI